MIATNEQTSLPESPFLRRQALRWRWEIAYYLLWIFLCIVLLASLNIVDLFLFDYTYSATAQFSILVSFVTNNKLGTMSLLILSVLLVFTPFLFKKVLVRGSYVAFQILEKSVPFHYLFQNVELNNEFYRSTVARIGSIQERLIRFSRVNANMAVRINWFAFYAFPRLYPWRITKLTTELKSEPNDCELQLSGDKAYGIDSAAGILLIGFLMIVLSGQCLAVTHFKEILIMFIQLGFLAIYSMCFSILLSILSYKAALIKLLSDRWPWELR